MEERASPVLGILRLDYDYPPALGDIDLPEGGVTAEDAANADELEAPAFMGISPLKVTSQPVDHSAPSVRATFIPEAR